MTNKIRATIREQSKEHVNQQIEPHTLFSYHMKGGETMNIKSTLTKCLVVLSILLMTISPISAADASAKSVAVATNGGTATAISGAEAYGHDANAKAEADAYANGPGATAYSEAFAKDIRPYVRPYCCNTCYPTRYHTTTACSVPMSN